MLVDGSVWPVVSSPHQRSLEHLAPRLIPALEIQAGYLMAPSRTWGYEVLPRFQQRWVNALLVTGAAKSGAFHRSSRVIRVRKQNWEQKGVMERQTEGFYVLIFDNLGQF